MLSLKTKSFMTTRAGLGRKNPLFVCFFDLNVVLFLQRFRTVFFLYFRLPGKILAKLVIIPTPISIFLWETHLIFLLLKYVMGWDHNITEIHNIRRHPSPSPGGSGRLGPSSSSSSISRRRASRIVARDTSWPSPFPFRARTQ